MHQEISDVTVFTLVISTVLLVALAGIIIYFLFAYQKKVHKHEEEVIMLGENFNKTLLLSKLEIQEETLDRIAKELHANIGQLVSVININLSAHLLQNLSDPNGNIKETKGLVKQLMAEIKRLSVTLNTDHVGKAGFSTMLQMELDRIRRTGLYKVDFFIEGDKVKLATEREIILFRLCQEILNNIIKHAGANQIIVRITYSYEYLLLLIQDNGTGFDLEDIKEKAKHTGSTGINNIYMRSKQINSTVDIQSTPDQGTKITVTIPL